MKLSNVSLSLPASTIFVALALTAGGCAHESQPPRVGTTETTSAPMTRAPDDLVASIQGPALSAPQEPQERTSIAEAGDARTGLTFVPQVEKIDVPNGAPIDQWSQRYPDASKQLADWMQHYPGTAAKLAVWSAAHPIRMRALVTWAASHRVESFEAFMYGRAGWSDLMAIRHEDPDGTSELIEWVRRSPSAATELATYEASLTWAKDHVRAPKGHVASAPHSAVQPVPRGADTNDENASPWVPTMSSLVR